MQHARSVQHPSAAHVLRQTLRESRLPKSDWLTMQKSAQVQRDNAEPPKLPVNARGTFDTHAKD